MRLSLIRRLAMACLLAAAIVQAVPPALADVLYVHAYSLDEYLLGEQKAEVRAGYSGGRLYIDKRNRLTGSFMKRFFGEEKEDRSTLHIFLDEDVIREFDWYKGKIFQYPLDRLADVEAMKVEAEKYEEAEEFLASRYQVKDPVFTLDVMPEKDLRDGYDCRVVKAFLRLETEDIKKKARSITRVEQTLWLSEDVPGYAEVNRFHQSLADRMGLEAERLGPLTYLLVYWKGSLEPIQDKLALVSGYPVRSEVTVNGAYEQHIDSPEKKISTMQIKSEIMTLKEAVPGPLDLAPFTPTASQPFGLVIVD